MSAGCVGTARAALDATVEHVTTRRQFGRAIGAFRATQAHLAWMAGRVHAMDAIVRSVGVEHARGASIETLSSIAKVFTSESAFAVCDRALQLHGALGFLETTGVARMLRDCRITRIFEGANDVLLVRLGAARLASRGSSTPVRHALLGPLASGIEEAVADLRARLGLSVMQKQLILQRVAKAEIALQVGLIAYDGSPIGRYAAEQLVEEGERALDDLGSAESEEETVDQIASLLYEARATSRS